MPLIATRGAASAQGFGEFAQAAAPVYIEDVFSTYLIDLLSGTGNQQIPHGLDLASKGGLTWIKSRTTTYGHTLGSPSTGTNQMLFTNTTDALTSASSFVSFDSNGTTITRAGGYFGNSSNPIVSWNFREQPKFFDIVTYTGNGSNRTIAHNLGSVPGCIIVKDTTNAGSAWAIYHTSLGNTKFLQFTTSAEGTSSGYWNNTTPTATEFTVGTNGNVNQNGATYVRIGSAIFNKN